MSLNTLGASLIKKIWVLCVILLILLAVYVGIGRIVMPRLDSYQLQLEKFVSEQLGLQVSAQQLQGGWQGFNPTVALRQITFKQPVTEDGGEQPPVLDIEKLTAQLDVFSSLLNRQAVFSSFALQGMTLALEQGAHRWQITGWPEKQRASDKNPFDWLLKQRAVSLTDVELILRPLDTPEKTLDVNRLTMRCRLTACSSQGRVSLQAADDGPLIFSLNSFGKPSKTAFRVQGYFKSAPVELADWKSIFSVEHQLVSGIEKLLVGGEVWFDWAAGGLQDIRGTLDVPHVELGSQNEALSAIDFLHTDFSWLRQTGLVEEQWALWLSGLTFKYAEEVFEPAQRRVSLLRENGDQIVRLSADRVSLAPVVGALLAMDSLPGNVRQPLRSLQPSGNLENVQIEYRLPVSGGKQQNPWFKIESQLQNVSISSWRHVPAIGGVSGFLSVGPEGGQVNLDSNDFQLHFPRVFSDRWQFAKANGLVSWVYEDETLWLNGQGLEMSGAVGDVTGRFSVLSSMDGLEPRLSLLIGLENAHLPDALTLLPDVVASPQLVSWLGQAFAAGDVNSARFVLEQKVKKGAKPMTRTMALDVDAQAVDFSFHPDWPHLTDAGVSVRIHDQQVAVQASTAHMFDLQLGDIKAHYEGKKGASRLVGTASVKGPLQDAWRTLTDTSLSTNLFSLAHDFQFDGQLSSGQLALDIPFASPNKTGVTLAFTTNNAKLSIPSVGIAATAIDGDFQYSTEQGLSAPQFSAQLFGFPAKGAISSRATAAGIATTLALQGHLKTPSLSRWVPAGVLNRLTGETDFKAELLVGKGAQNYLRIDSWLEGVSVDLPAPMTKAAGESLPFSFNLSLLESQIHELRYGDQLSYALRFSDQGYRDGQIQVGATRANYRGGDHIQVDGHLPLFDYQHWFDFFQQLQQPSEQAVETSGKGDSLVSRIGTVKLNTDVFRFMGQDYQKMDFDAQQVAGDWRIRFDNDDVQGELAYFKDPVKPLVLAFDFLSLAEAHGQSGLEVAKKDVLGGVVPQNLPALDVRVDQLLLAGEPFGHWSFKLRPMVEGARLAALDAELKGAQLTGELDWLHQAGTHRSVFSGEVLIPNAAEMLKAWHKPAAIEAANTLFSGQLEWVGSPANFSLFSVQGPVDVKANKGRIIDMTSLSLLSVLNFNSLSRRFRLDFSDLFKKGFSFDSVEGRLQFDQGQLLMAEPLIIDGPSAKFKIEGRTDMVNEQFDHDVIAVLPVKDSIPVIATLAGFPQVGVPIYLFNRAFGGMLDRFTSVNYRVTGSWDKPDIKLASFFDTQDLPEMLQPSTKKDGKEK